MVAARVRWAWNASWTAWTLRRRTFGWRWSSPARAVIDPRQDQLIGLRTPRRPKSGRTITMTSSTKRRLAWRIGAVLAAAAASATLPISAASANSDVTPPAGITVPGNATGAPAVLVASLEGRNEVNPGAPQGQALELIGIQGNTLSYSVSWRGIGTPTAADIHAGARGVDGPVVVPLFTTPRPAGGFASGTVTVTDPTLLDALRSNPQGFYADLHTTTFPDGAARAQLHALNHTVATSGVAALQESVIFGSQIYACTVQTDGLFAFTQHDVEARLSGG